jgi:hypothetical protein
VTRRARRSLAVVILIDLALFAAAIWLVLR